MLHIRHNRSIVHMRRFVGSPRRRWARGGDSKHMRSFAASAGELVGNASLNVLHSFSVDC